MLKYADVLHKLGYYWQGDEEDSAKVKLSPRQIKAIQALLDQYHAQNDWLGKKDRKRKLKLQDAVYETGDPADTVYWLGVKDPKDPEYDLQDALGGHDYAYDSKRKEVFVQ